MSSDLLALAATPLEGEVSHPPLWTEDALDDHLDGLLDDLAEEVEAGNEQAVEDILVTMVDYHQRVDRADRRTRTILRRKTLRSVFRIGWALRRVEGKVKRDLYAALETKTGADRDTLQNYRVVAGHYTPEQVIYDVAADVYMFLASFPPATRKHWLETAHGQAKQTGQPMGKWKIKLLMQEGQGNLTPQQHLDTGTTPPGSHKIVNRTASGTNGGGGSGSSAPLGSAPWPSQSGQATPAALDVNEELWSWAVESLGVMRDALAQYAGMDKANAVLIPLIQKGQALFNTPSVTATPEPDWDKITYLTPDDLEPLETAPATTGYWDPTPEPDWSTP